MANENLIDLARAEDFTDDALEETFAESKRERDQIDILKGPGAHLLEGPRGVGKSTLFKKAELELDNEFNASRRLGVYVNFKASLLVDSDSADLGYDPFICWVAAKVLDAFYRKARKVHLLSSDEINERYKRHFGIESAWSPTLFEEIVRDLQSLAIASNEEARSRLVKRIASVQLEQFANAESVADFIREIALKNASVEQIIFLFDEAAHTFDERQQGAFFEFFKLLHGAGISVKAATYPGITSYGGNFEVGQDAIKLSISSFDENLEASRLLLRGHFREMLSRRLPGVDYGQVIKAGEALDMLILLSHGNPRMFLQTVSKWLRSGELSKRSALAASNDFVANELANYHLGLRKRLPRFASHIELGMALVKSHLVPEIQKKNEGKGDAPKIQSVYFTLESTIPYKVHRAVSLLEYSGFLFDKSVVKTAKRRSARRFALNLGVAASERVFHSSLSRDPDVAIKLLSVADYREFYESDVRFSLLVEDHPSLELCPNGHARIADGAFCSVCGLRFAPNRVVESLLDDSVDKLNFSEFLRSTLRDQFNALTVRDVIGVTESDLQKAKWIGPFRAKSICNAAEEYITG